MAPSMGTVCCTSGHHHGLELWWLYTVFFCCGQCVPNEKVACFQYSLNFSPILLWWVLCKLCHHYHCVYDIRLCGMCWIQQFTDIRHIWYPFKKFCSLITDLSFDTHLDPSTCSIMFSHLVKCKHNQYFVSMYVYLKFHGNNYIMIKYEYESHTVHYNYSMDKYGR